MNGYLAASFYRFHMLENQNQGKQPDRPNHMGWPVPREGKALWN